MLYSQNQKIGQMNGSKQGNNINKNYNYDNLNNPNTINNNNVENTNKIYFENYNNNILDKNRKDIFPDNSKIFNILESENEIYIANTKKFELIKILRDDTSNIKRINTQDIIPENLKQKAQADGIIGIFDLNYIKYLGIIISYEETATIFNSKIYLINSIELIKISKKNEFQYNKDLKQNINDLINTKNFYYSNDYKLTLSLNHQEQEEKNSKYLLNYILLTSFFDNNIPDYFYSKMILGFASSKNNIKFENKPISLDIIIIERYFNENFIIKNNGLIYIKQIEFISIFKNMNNNDDIKTFSFILYENGEIINSINSFVPFKLTFIEELNQFQNLICIINNLNKKISSMQIQKIIKNNNSSLLNNKIKKTIISSDQNERPFEKFDPTKHMDFFSNTNSNTQFFCFLFIYINNTNFENNIFNKCMEILFLEIFKKEISFQNIDINIEEFDINRKNIIFTKFLELIAHYEVEINNNRTKLIQSPKKEMFQIILDKYLTNNNIKSEESQNLNKIKILCITWNVGSQELTDDYDISEIFKKNQFYINNQSPDIVVISFQEIVKLNLRNSLKSKNDKEFINKINIKLRNTLNKTFPEQNYISPSSDNQVGLYFIPFFKKEVLLKVFFVDVTEDKTGKFNLGNKGYFTFSFKYMDNIFSIANCHFASGLEKNDKRIKTLKGILNKDIRIDANKIQKFKDADFWIIQGDLNFRIDLSYEEAMSYILKKNYNALYSKDQFHLAYEDEANSFLKDNINEGTIKFAPTYKFEINSDNYAFNKKKIRVPSWCDRIFFCKKNGIKIINYDSIPNLKISDHRPVTAAFEVIPNKKEISDKNEFQNQNEIINDWEIFE